MLTLLPSSSPFLLLQAAVVLFLLLLRSGPRSSRQPPATAKALSSCFTLALARPSHNACREREGVALISPTAVAPPLTAYWSTGKLGIDTQLEMPKLIASE